jgi:hypothetical protein
VSRAATAATTRTGRGPGPDVDGRFTVVRPLPVPGRSPSVDDIPG